MKMIWKMIFCATVFMINVLFARDSPPLHEVVAQRDILKIKALLAANADVNAKDNEGNTALYLLVSEYAGAFSNKHWREGEHHDISEEALAKWLQETLEIMPILLAAGADANAKGGHSNDSVLAQAVRFGGTETVRLLLDAGADVNAQNQYGYTPLFNAVDRYGSANPEVVKLLLAAGANVNHQTERQYGGAKTALMLAVSGRAEVVQILIDAGADVNLQGESMYALGEAVFWGQTNIVRMLLAAGADVNKKPPNKYSKDAIVTAVTSKGIPSPAHSANTTELVKLLLDAGTNPDVDNVLFVAAENRKIGATELLLASGANPNIINDRGETPLMHIVREHAYCFSDEKRKFLVKLVGETNPQHIEGTLKIGIDISTYGFNEIVKLLLDASTDITIKNKDGKTVREMAEEASFDDIIALLDIKEGRTTP